MTPRRFAVSQWTVAGFAVLMGATATAVAQAATTAPADANASHHHRAPAAPTVFRSTVRYVVPNVTLVRADGKRVNFKRELDDGRPVLLDFIYTTCTTICPVMSQTFADVQRLLGPNAARLKMMSVSIDPDEDTPAHLAVYAKRYQAGGQWSFYTGSFDAIMAAQQAFNVYRGDKMNHAPVTLYRSAPGRRWVRLDGFATPASVLRELPAQLARK